MTTFQAAARTLTLAVVTLLPVFAPPASGSSDSPAAGIMRITAPGADTVLSGSLTIGVQASDPTGVRAITLYADGIRINTFMCSTPTCVGAFNWVTDVHLPAGPHTLIAVSTNTAGVRVQSVPVTVLKSPALAERLERE
jgi:Bacterial Ig domain